MLLGTASHDRTHQYRPTDYAVRIWDVTNPENILKLATRPLSGKINDLAWDGESKRIVVGGEGKDKFGAAFFMDSGTSCGEISGHAKVSSFFLSFLDQTDSLGDHFDRHTSPTTIPSDIRIRRQFCHPSQWCSLQILQANLFALSICQGRRLRPKRRLIRLCRL